MGYAKEETVKIGIDARQISHRKRHGLRTYVENLVKALSIIDQKNEYVLYLDAKDPFDLNDLGPNFTIKILPWHIRYLSTLLNDHLIIPRKVIKDGLDIMHYPTNPVNFWKTTTNVHTVHDALPFFGRKSSLLKTGILKGLSFRYNAALIWKATKTAASIITVSQNSKQDLIKHTDLHESNIQVIHEAAGNEFQEIKDEAEIKNIKEKFRLGKKFILGFAHKNGTWIIESFGNLPPAIRKEYKIGLISIKKRLSREIRFLVRKYKLEKSVICIPPVPEKDLVLLYNAASLFVFPSFYEGFGLPVLESMKCGCPVICSKRGSLPEVAGDAVEYIQELDNKQVCIAELSDRIEKLLKDESIQETFVQKGIEQAGKFSWEKAARETLKVYEMAYRLGKK